MIYPPKIIVQNLQMLEPLKESYLRGSPCPLKFVLIKLNIQSTGKPLFK